MYTKVSRIPLKRSKVTRVFKVLLNRARVNTRSGYDRGQGYGQQYGRRKKVCGDFEFLFCLVVSENNVFG